MSLWDKGIEASSMNYEELARLLETSECESLEWKSDFPKSLLRGRESPNWDKGRAELLKDLISLANSPGQALAYLVYGVKDLRIRREITGISKSFDDADFQQWAKNTFDPSPKFQYTEILWPPSKTIGIFQIEKIPDYPHVVKENIGDILHKGQVWFRTGSQNAVALRSDIEKMFWGEKPVKFSSLLDTELERIKKIYRDQGREIEFPLLEDKENRLLRGYEIATYPGTRQGIVVGRGKAELVFLLKPKGRK